MRASLSALGGAIVATGLIVRLEHTGRRERIARDPEICLSTSELVQAALNERLTGTRRRAAADEYDRRIGCVSLRPLVPSL